MCTSLAVSHWQCVQLEGPCVAIILQQLRGIDVLQQLGGIDVLRLSGSSQQLIEIAAPAVP